MNKIKALSALAAMAVSVPAMALNMDFGDLKFINNANVGFLPTDGVRCTSGDLCSSDVDHGVRNGDLTFSKGGVVVHATGSFNSGAAAVVQDHENGYDPLRLIGAGLGVYHKSGDTTDDNITFGEKLTLTFDHAVTITGIGLRSEGHNVNEWISGATFLLNGAPVALPRGTGEIDHLQLTGTSFTFAYGGSHADQFYLSSLDIMDTVPEPASGSLLLAGLGALGLAARRRRSA
jgi:hypothetical protein